MPGIFPPMPRQSPWQYVSITCGLFLAWTKICSGKTVREALNESARAMGEVFFVESMAGKRRNNWFISSFSDDESAEKAHTAPTPHLFRVSLSPDSDGVSSDFRISLMPPGCRPAKQKRRKAPEGRAVRRQGFDSRQPIVLLNHQIKNQAHISPVSGGNMTFCCSVGACDI